EEHDADERGLAVDQLEDERQREEGDRNRARGGEPLHLLALDPLRAAKAHDERRDRRGEGDRREHRTGVGEAPDQRAEPPPRGGGREGGRGTGGGPGRGWWGRPTGERGRPPGGGGLGSCGYEPCELGERKAETVASEL